MATRSRIGVELEGGKVISVYCHHDGYISGVGTDLMKKFPNGTDSSEVEEYIKEGDRSSVDLSYKEWRDEKCPPQKRASVPLFFDGDIEEYGYLYTAEGEWLVKKSGSQVERDPVPLAYVLSGTVNI
jgi:hypothetical protein